MKLKEYQERTLGEVKRFLEQLVVWRGKAREGDEWNFDFAERAWEKAGVGRMYLKKKDGLGRPLPSYCLKIPTGGGKTLLAVKTIDLVQSIYRQRRALGHLHLERELEIERVAPTGVSIFPRKTRRVLVRWTAHRSSTCILLCRVDARMRGPRIRRL